MKNRHIIIKEYDRIYEDERYGEVMVSKRDIDELRDAIDAQNTLSDNHSSLGEFLKPIKKGIQANNFVGILQTKSGLTIEILPKIYSPEKEHTIQDVRNLFWEMLATVNEIDGKAFRMTSIGTKKANLLELFIYMFLLETDSIIKKGLKSSYLRVQKNVSYLKGKLLMTQQIRHNTVDASKFYSEFDEFLLDSPENQIIRKTLEYILKKTKDHQNHKLAREQLVYFRNVQSGYNANNLFKKVHLNRSDQYYEQALKWSKIFLQHQSFTPLKGNSIAFALLFPMERVFESYITKLVKYQLTELDISSQDRKHWLFDSYDAEPNSFRLRPDLVARSKEGSVVIADTKWKILSEKSPSQSDLYQMYAYFTRYKQNGENVKKAVLIYPYNVSNTLKEFRSYQGNGVEAVVQVQYVDLFSNDLKRDIKSLF